MPLPVRTKAGFVELVAVELCHRLTIYFDVNVRTLALNLHGIPLTRIMAHVLGVGRQIIDCTKVMFTGTTAVHDFR